MQNGLPVKFKDPKFKHENFITIHAIKIGFLNFTWKVLSLKVVQLPLACQSEHSLPYFHLDRISDSFAIHRSSSHMLLAAEKRFGVASLVKHLGKNT